MKRDYSNISNQTNLVGLITSTPQIMGALIDIVKKTPVMSFDTPLSPLKLLRDSND